MKISFGKTIISPEVGTPVAGYGPHDVSYAKLDDLYADVLALDDGTSKGVIISFDLIGLDAVNIQKIRKNCAKLFKGDESQVIVSCTHTHSGPNCQMLSDYPQYFEKEYVEQLIKTTAKLVKSVLAGKWIDTSVFFCSLDCDANTNRRFVTKNNRASFLPHRRDMERIADGICDKEVGMLCFVNKETCDPAYIIGNFAAHPLAGHAPGLGGHRISADYPGAFKRYIESETGAGCMFLSGAAGDMVPKWDETGIAAINDMGTRLAQTVIASIIIATRDKNSYMLQNETMQFGFEYATRPVRPFRKNALHTIYKGKDEITYEMQLFSIGDICLIGVPGEVVAELGLEMKWHSPFRKAFVLYCSTGYMDYLCHGNALVAGGYEGHEQWTDSRTGLALVNAAVDGMYKLYERTFPDKSKWPENISMPLVSIVNTHN